MLLPLSLRADGIPAANSDRSRFERGEHGRPIDLGQQIVLQVHREIHVQQLGKVVGQILACEPLSCRPERIVAGQRLEDPRGQHRLLHLGRVRTEPGVVASDRVLFCSGGETAHQVIQTHIPHGHGQGLEQSSQQEVA